ncbi:MAG: alpha-ribazole phosphatase [Geobacteraceae bacterium]|nr:alpha-ribazole phosphatase [Geobacteraceae bacterium]
MNRSGQIQAGCTIYLLRHGDSRPDAVRRFIGRSDGPLNEAGRSQAERWRRELSRIPFSRICCSDLQRSVETARIIGRRIKAPLTVLPGLAEIDLGRWDGLPFSEVRRLFPREYEQRGADLAGYRPPGGENFADLSDRVLPVFEGLLKPSAENILIVGHAGVNRVILCHLLGLPLANLFRLEQGYGCLNVLEYAHEAWLVRSVNIPAGNDNKFQLARR